MLFYFLIFSAAVLSTSLLPSLPAPESFFLFILLFLLISFKLNRRCRGIIFAFSAGLIYGVFSGYQLMSAQLPEAESGKEFLLTGKITGLPKQESRQLRFWFDVDNCLNHKGEEVSHNRPERVQISWYLRSQDSIPKLKPGDHWQLKVKLHRPRSFVNPAGFDYQLWLLRNGIGATGYVVKGDNRRLENSGKDLFGYIGQLRFYLQQWVINNSRSPHKGILAALLIGDSAEVEKNDWQIMQRTGTNHLIAISGLHVGFLAIAGFYAGLFMGRLLQLCRCSVPAQFFAYVSAILVAGFYSALAGFNIPTVRTLLMLSIFYWICLRQRETQFIQIFCLALVLVVIIDPLAAYDIGFWLSFGAVALLLMGFSGRRKLKGPVGLAQKISQLILDYALSQWLMLVGLLVPLVLFISSFSLTSPIANAVAIPLITFGVVPCLLIGALLDILYKGLGEWLLVMAGYLLEGLIIFLKHLLNLFPFESNPLISLMPSIGIYLAFCCFLLLLPKGFFSKKLSAIALGAGLLVAMFLPKPNQPDLKLVVLDVGQGTAIVVQVGNKTLIYDTGAKFSDNFDAGSGILVPYLKSQAIRQVDILAVSHNDLDHAGGLAGVMNNLVIDQLLLGQYLPLFRPDETQKNLYALANQVNSCHEFPDWQWQEVSFRFLKWPLRNRANANNYSCVLQITYKEQVIVIPGDLEREVEMQLIANQQLAGDIQLLIAGHHGSLTSSSPDFVAQVRPKQVVYSAGYANRYGHPHPRVRERFQKLGSEEFLTSTQGALEFSWKRGVNLPVLAYRQIKQRYWY